MAEGSTGTDFVYICSSVEDGKALHARMRQKYSAYIEEAVLSVADDGRAVLRVRTRITDPQLAKSVSDDVQIWRRHLLSGVDCPVPVENAELGVVFYGELTDDEKEGLRGTGPVIWREFYPEYVTAVVAANPGGQITEQFELSEEAAVDAAEKRASLLHATLVTQPREWTSAELFRRSTARHAYHVNLNVYLRLDASRRPAMMLVAPNHRIVPAVAGKHSPALAYLRGEQG